jgi:hydrogenase maturation protease
MSSSEAPTGRTLVLGIGNDILSDDGVGLLAARRIGELVGDRAEVAEASVATIDLLALMSGYQRVIITDAFISPEVPPGTPVRATPQDLPPGFGYRSFHTLTFQEVMEIGCLLGIPMPEEVLIHGLAVDETSTFGEELTPRVAAAWRVWADDIVSSEFGLEGDRTRSPRPVTGGAAATETS